MLAETFYRPPAGGSKQRFADDFVLKGEVEFETGFIVEVGDLVWEGNTVSGELARRSLQPEGPTEPTQRPVEPLRHHQSHQRSSLESISRSARLGCLGDGRRGLPLTSTELQYRP